MCYQVQWTNLIETGTIIIACHICFKISKLHRAVKTTIYVYYCILSIISESVISAVYLALDKNCSLKIHIILHKLYHFFSFTFLHNL